MRHIRDSRGGLDKSLNCCFEKEAKGVQVLLEDLAAAAGYIAGRLKGVYRFCADELKAGYEAYRDF